MEVRGSSKTFLLTLFASGETEFFMDEENDFKFAVVLIAFILLALFIFNML